MSGVQKFAIWGRQPQLQGLAMQCLRCVQKIREFGSTIDYSYITVNSTFNINALSDFVGKTHHIFHYQVTIFIAKLMGCEAMFIRLILS